MIQIAWRANITSRGYLAVDDFVLASRAAGSELTTDFLFGMWINHLMPGAKLLYWLSTEKFGLAYWPYVVLLITCQAMISVAFAAL